MNTTSISNQTAGLLPPKRFLNHAYCHWVQKRDFDGRTMGLGNAEVWQWQPAAKAWCRPGFVATGEEKKLEGYVYIAYCPHPMFKVEADELKELLKELTNRVRGYRQCGLLTADELRRIKTAIAESMAIEE